MNIADILKKHSLASNKLSDDLSEAEELMGSECRAAERDSYIDAGIEVRSLINQLELLDCDRSADEQAVIVELISIREEIEDEYLFEDTQEAFDLLNRLQPKVPR